MDQTEIRLQHFSTQLFFIYIVWERHVACTWKQHYHYSNFLHEIKIEEKKVEKNA